MLLVMSDIHFAESHTNQLGYIAYNPNLPALVYLNYFLEIRGLITQNQVKKVDMVLAGDIFEITRSGLWLKDELRPYMRTSAIQPGSAEEARVLEILDAIAKDNRVAETLAVIKSLDDILGVPVEVHFIPGNHDRLVNSTLAVRHKVQEMLGLPENDEIFNTHYIYHTMTEPLVLVRHGHEYDPGNFGRNVIKLDSIPTAIDADAYDLPVVGDIVTVELATRLPVFFKRYYTEATIIESTLLRRIYQRLIEFDNVRPATALLNFLFATPGIPRRDTWKLMEPVFVNMLVDIGEQQTVMSTIQKIMETNPLQATLIRIILKMKFWHKGVPYWMIRQLMKIVSRKIKLQGIAAIVAKEACLLDNQTGIKCVIAGHTHVPEAEILTIVNRIEKYYLNSGTWRTQIPATPDMLQFGRLRSLTKVLVFGAEECNPEYDSRESWSFDYNAEYGYGPELGYQEGADISKPAEA